MLLLHVFLLGMIMISLNLYAHVGLWNMKVETNVIDYVVDFILNLNVFWL
ncbi:hypothetical protein ACJX0J_018922 [Zea mays]